VEYDFAIEDPGYFRLPYVSYRWGDWTQRTRIGGGHGHTNLQRAIYQSCNTFFYELGYKMGIDMIHGFMSQFGFGANIALDVPYARTGVLPSKAWKMETRGEPWYPGDTVNISIGQSFMWVTPLQLAAAVSIVANRGEVVQPRMLKTVNGQAYEHPLENSVPDIMLADADYWRFVEEAMTMVVHRPFNNTFRDYGTAYESIALADPGMSYKMAGKSGTAQVVSIDQSVRKSDEIEVSDLNRDNGLFMAFAPASNPFIAPQIALAVFVENGESGSNVAGPIAKKIIDAYLLDILELDFAEIEAQAEGKMLISDSDD
ncbi:MAG: penicillin-binding transpeptidase domain-containing protein, partial [Gammaproteobacteria bacterium]